MAVASPRSPAQRPTQRPAVTRPALVPVSAPASSRRNSRRFQPRSQQTTRPPTQSQRVPRSHRHDRQTTAPKNRIRPSIPRSPRSRSTLAKQLLPAQRSTELNCDDPQTQQALNRCAFQAFTEANRRLNVAYRQLLPNLSDERRQLLRNSQIAWAAYRDRECRFYDSSVEGGSLQPLLSSGCKTRLTRDRIGLLRRYREGQASPTIPADNQITERQRQQRYRQVQARLAGFQGSDNETDHGAMRSQLLRNAEQAWRRYRDQACRFETNGGGNAANVTCHQWHINQRYIQLGQHGDL